MSSNSFTSPVSPLKSPTSPKSSLRTPRSPPISLPLHPPYAYPSVPLQRTHIRLLTLTRIEQDGPLAATLATHALPPLAVRPPYFWAVSWTWPSSNASGSSGTAPGGGCGSGSIGSAGLHALSGETGSGSTTTASVPILGAATEEGCASPIASPASSSFPFPCQPPSSTGQIPYYIPLTHNPGLPQASHHLPVSPRLWVLLHDLLPIDGSPATTRLWIDAICINQSNNVEKVTHVPRMHRVYGMAAGCAAWLGGVEEEQRGTEMAEGGEGEQIGIESAMDEQLLRRVKTGLEQIEGRRGSGPDPGFAEKLENLSLDSSQESDLPSRSDPFWPALGSLFDRSWFYRTWIVQEVAVPRQVLINLAGLWVSWDSLLGVVEIVSRLGIASWSRGARSTGKTRPDGFGVSMDLNWTRRTFWVPARTQSSASQAEMEAAMMKNGLDLGYLLRMIRLKEVTRPVDKIYGLLALVGNEVRGLVRVRYDDETDERFYEVYEEVVRALMQRDRMAFWLLCMAPSRERPAGMATWCPNFNSINPNYLDLYHQPFQTLTPIASSDTATLAPTLNVGIKPDPGNSKQLRIFGRGIDTVTAVFYIGGPYATAVDHEGDAFVSATESFMSGSKTCLEIAERLYPSPGEGKSAYVRALVMNTGSNFQVVPPDGSDSICDAYDATISVLISQHKDQSSPPGKQPLLPAPTNLTDVQLTAGKAMIKQLGWWQERPIFFTKQGRVGRGCWSMQAGDQLCRLYGAGPLFVLRQYRNQEVAELVGDAYLHGCMDSEPGMKRNADSKEKEFVLV